MSIRVSAYFVFLSEVVVVGGDGGLGMASRFMHRIKTGQKL